MLKQLLQAGIILAGFAAMPSWAISINDGGAYDGTDVGAIDEFLAIRDGVNGDAAELAFINEFAEPDYVFSITDLKLSDVDYYTTDGNSNSGDVYAFGPAELGDYFIVKNSTYTAVFQNKAEDMWGVFDLGIAALADLNLGTDPFQISHVSRTPTTTTDVPEPGMVGLLAIGLLGMVVARRRTKV